MLDSKDIILKTSSLQEFDNVFYLRLILGHEITISTRKRQGTLAFIPISAFDIYRKHGLGNSSSNFGRSSRR